MKRTSDVIILGTVVYGVSISTTTFTLRSRTSLGSMQMNNQSKASKSDCYGVMTSEKRSPTYVVYHFDTQRLSPTWVCKKYMYYTTQNIFLYDYRTQVKILTTFTKFCCNWNSKVKVLQQVYCANFQWEINILKHAWVNIQQTMT